MVTTPSSRALGSRWSMRDPRQARRLVVLALAVCTACQAPGKTRIDGTTETASGTGRTLVAVSNMKHPPFSSWNDDGEAVGLEVELVEEAARELGWPVRWVERPFGELLTAVASGEADVAVSTIGITEERKERVAFSDPYFQTQIVALVLDDAASPRSLAELDRAAIGADEGTTAYPAARARWPSATLVGRVRDGMTWPEMIERRIIDALVVDASDRQRLESMGGVPLLPLEPPLSAEHFGIAVELGDDDLRSALNRAIARRVRRARLETRGARHGPSPLVPDVLRPRVTSAG